MKGLGLDLKNDENPWKGTLTGITFQDDDSDYKVMAKRKLGGSCNDLGEKG